MKIFVEYAVKKEVRKAYLVYISQMLKNHSNLEIYEGTDQPSLFVEIWNNSDYQKYEVMKHERKGNISHWSPLNLYIEGGAEKLHIWHFTKIKRDNDLESC